MSGGSSMRGAPGRGDSTGAVRFSRMYIIRTNASYQALRGRISGGGKAWQPLHTARASFSRSGTVAAWDRGGPLHAARSVGPATRAARASVPVRPMSLATTHFFFFVASLKALSTCFLMLL
jgi:hypothetical protein